MTSSTTWFVIQLTSICTCHHRSFLLLILVNFSLFELKVLAGEPFSSKDYMAPTPSWAVYGAEEGGFDPQQSRYRKERHHKSAR